jgi:quercetin dioxygenase-like cupin family protein
VRGQTLHADERGVVAELALDRDASISPHSNPNLTYFLVIEGGGFVRVGDETARVSAGDAVVWPPDVVHAARTEGSPMRAIVVEFAGNLADRARALLEASLGETLPADPSEPEPRAIPTGRTPTADEGEPW